MFKHSDVSRCEIGKRVHKVASGGYVELILGTPGVWAGDADSCWADTHNWNRWEGGDNEGNKRQEIKALNKVDMDGRNIIWESKAEPRTRHWTGNLLTTKHKLKLVYETRNQKRDKFSTPPSGAPVPLPSFFSWIFRNNDDDDVS